MSNYETMQAAARQARANYIAYRDRVWGHFAKLMRTMISHSSIPEDHIVYLKWNEVEGPDGRFTKPEDPSHQYTMPGAVSYDTRDNSFNLGLRIYLTPANTAPRHSVGFAVWISEAKGESRIRIGQRGNWTKLNFEEQAEVDSFCDQIAKDTVDAFSESPKDKTKSLGFDVSPFIS